jgi:NADPH-dependent glutamate synthase beta subunit-like oxidoreductase
MKPFNHINPKSLDEIADVMSKGKAKLIAGGTDLLGTLKDNILPNYPAVVVNLKSVPGLDYIKEENGVLKIGALTRLADISKHEIIKEKYTALAQATHAVATPHIRDMGTIGGNITQLPRCWYFRKPENRFPCIRKGGKECYAILGDNRYHSIFGGKRLQPAPCSKECPAGTDIPTYFEQIRKGDWDAAAKTILKVNPLPMITGRICAHPCQSGCNRNETDESVSINCVERTLGDYILENSDKFYAPPATETGKSVAIVGSGPASLTAAYYLRKAGNKVTIYDEKEEAGGMLMYAIPAYRLPKDLVRKVIGIYKKMGIDFKLSTKVGEKVGPEELERNYDSVLYATGAWKRPVIGISGEALTVFGLDFLVEIQKWMDNKIGKEVFVYGGGNVALDVALSAKRLGAKKVTLACRRLSASSEEIARAEEEGIVIMTSWGTSRVVEEDGVAKGMELKRMISSRDAAGAYKPQYDENDKITVCAENILMAVGQQADLSFLSEKYQLQLSRRGLLDVDDMSMTSRKGIFGAGDAIKPGLAIAAIATGHKAANGMNRYLGTYAGEEKTANNAYLINDADGIVVKVPLKLRELDASNRRIDVEDSISPTMAEAAEEVKRCMNCGCYAVSPSDTAPALIALGARIVTNKRTIYAEDYFDVRIESNTVLEQDEIVTELQIPAPPADSKSAFIKMAYRKAIDFPVVNCAVLTGSVPRVVLGAVAPMPYRAKKAEMVVAGREINEVLAEEAGAAAVADAHSFNATKYKMQLAKVMVKRALLSTIQR